MACAESDKDSDEESGRGAEFFHVGEDEVRSQYVSSGLSWDETIKELLLNKSTSGADEVPAEFSDGLDKEIKKIKRECRIP